jgi:hypothetical protein
MTVADMINIVGIHKNTTIGIQLCKINDSAAVDIKATIINVRNQLLT